MVGIQDFVLCLREARACAERPLLTYAVSRRNCTRKSTQQRRSNTPSRVRAPLEPPFSVLNSAKHMKAKAQDRTCCKSVKASRPREQKVRRQCGKPTGVAIVSITAETAECRTEEEDQAFGPTRTRGIIYRQPVQRKID